MVHQTRPPSFSVVQFWCSRAYYWSFRGWTGVSMGTLSGLQLRSPILNKLWCFVCSDSFLLEPAWTLSAVCATVALLWDWTRWASLRSPRLSVDNFPSSFCAFLISTMWKCVWKFFFRPVGVLPRIWCVQDVILNIKESQKKCPWVVTIQNFVYVKNSVPFASHMFSNLCRMETMYLAMNWNWHFIFTNKWNFRRQAVACFIGLHTCPYVIKPMGLGGIDGETLHRKFLAAAF